MLTNRILINKLQKKNYIKSTEQTFDFVLYFFYIE